MSQRITYYSRIGGSRSFPAVSAPPAGDSVAATNFINRALAVFPTLNAAHQTAYKDLLNGLTTDGLFNSDGTSSYFDVLYIFATQDTSVAVLNLVSSSFTGGLNGGPAFVADQGYTGVENSGTVYIETNFNPTSGSPKFTQNSAHVSLWSNTSAADAGAGCAMGMWTNANQTTQIFPRHNDGNAYFRITDSGNTAGVANADGSGHYVSNRDSSTTQQGYINAIDKSAPSLNSDTVVNGTLSILAGVNWSTSAHQLGWAGQATMASIGASLSAALVTAFYGRLRTYMTAVGIP